MDDALKPLYERGLKVRKEVLGEAYVNNAVNSADEFSQPLQEYVTAHGWGASWASRWSISTASMHGRA